MYPVAPVPQPISPEIIETQHLVHLLVAILTGGLWLIPWAIIGYSNHRTNQARRKDFAWRQYHYHQWYWSQFQR
ncbi:MAG: hypothetical protein GEU83_12135 [Pseudonocardiaceae bacterium]|nr:hypothetical protein [Pseudonocardiaceae bacterium]